MRASLQRSHCRGKRHLENFKTLREVLNLKAVKVTFLKWETCSTHLHLESKKSCCIVHLKEEGSDHSEYNRCILFAK